MIAYDPSIGLMLFALDKRTIYKYNKYISNLTNKTRGLRRLSLSELREDHFCKCDSVRYKVNSYDNSKYKKLDGNSIFPPLNIAKL